MGSIVFILYINDICKVSTVIKYITFVDETDFLYTCIRKWRKSVNNLTITSVEIILKEFILKQIVGVYIYNQLDGNDCIKKINCKIAKNLSIMNLS